MSELVEYFKDIIRLIQWYPLRWIFSVLPPPLLSLIAKAAGMALYLTAHSRRKIMTEEFRRCFPEKSSAELGQITRKAFIAFVLEQFDVLQYPHLDAVKTERYSRISGEEHLRESDKKGKGVILLLCHLGSNQFIMPILGFKGYHIGQVSLPADAVQAVFGSRKISLIHRKILHLKRKMEESLPCTHIFLQKGIWEGTTWLKDGKILAIAVDGRHGTRFVKHSFSQRTAQYSPGPFLMALRTGAPLLPVFVIRDGSMKHRMIIEKPLDMTSLEEYSQKEKIGYLLDLYIQRLEHYFQQYPELYGMFFYLARIHTGGKENALFLDYR